MAFMISAGEFVVFIQFGPHGHDLLLRDLSRKIADHDLFLCQQVIH